MVPSAILPILALLLLAPGRGTEDRSIEHNGKSRIYRLHTPGNFAKGKPIPLVIVLHGAGANGKITEALTGFSPLADRHEIHGGGHTWPDGNFQPEALLGKTCHDINASQIIWDFFAPHKLPEPKKNSSARE